VTDQPLHNSATTRRAALAGTGLAGVALLAACSSSSTSVADGTSSSAVSAAATPGGAMSSASAAASSGGGSVLGTTSEIPVGGGKVFSAAKVVVTQPSAGEYMGFSAVCTHQQCLVDQVANGTIDCPCHGSEFSIKDGSVVAGPAPTPLPAAKVTVSGDQITLG
jgi:Rieske Fe-S protein